MVQVAGAAKKKGDAIFGVGFALRSVRGRPIGFALIFDGGNYHRDRLVKSAQDFSLRQLSRLGEFQIAIADVAGAGESGADVVTEVSRQMQQKMPDTVSVRKRIAPELLLGKRVHPFVKFRSAVAIFAGEGCAYTFGKLAQNVFSRAQCVADALSLRKIMPSFITNKTFST